MLGSENLPFDTLPATPDCPQALLGSFLPLSAEAEVRFVRMVNQEKLHNSQALAGMILAKTHIEWSQKGPSDDVNLCKF